jgi:23S rRNA pseudouridine2605 synthase
MRLQVFLSRSGACSRRKALTLIFAGRVRVNGRSITEPSFDICPDKDRVLLDSRPLAVAVFSYILFHKPSGVVTTKSDRFAQRTVLDCLPEEMKHLNPVGRLDKDTTGLLLMTNDGDLAHHLMHPSFDVEKVYRVRLDKPLEPSDAEKLEKGVVLEAKKTRPCRIRPQGAGDIEVTIHEGRKRQVRRMFALLGYAVKTLVRVRQGPLALGDLEPGGWRPLTDREVRALKGAAATPSARRKR